MGGIITEEKRKGVYEVMILRGDAKMDGIRHSFILQCIGHLVILYRAILTIRIFLLGLLRFSRMRESQPGPPVPAPDLEAGDSFTAIEHRPTGHGDYASFVQVAGLLEHAGSTRPAERATHR